MVWRINRVRNSTDSDLVRHENQFVQAKEKGGTASLVVLLVLLLLAGLALEILY